MSGTTDNPNDPDLTRGVDAAPVGQAKKYLVLSEVERAKGFVRPYRDAYRHVGQKPKYPLVDLTEAEHERYDQYSYVKKEVYPDDGSGLVGRYWTQAQLDALGCGNVTVMGRAIAETYARDPGFYGSTYCTTCMKHLPVAEFTWYEMDGTEGPVLGS